MSMKTIIAGIAISFELPRSAASLSRTPDGSTLVKPRFMLMSLFFFRKLQTLRDGSTDQLCIASTLVAGLSILGGAVIVFAAREMGLVPALVVLAVTGLFWVMVVYMFYWQLGEGMSIGMSESGQRHAT